MSESKMSLICALLIIAPWCTHAATPAAGASDLVYVYIHGFGGIEEKPRFCDNLRAFCARVKLGCEVRNYAWDSVKIKVLKAGAAWLEAEKRADREAPRFRTEVIDKLESEQRPYVLVGFSVGTRVILSALNQTDTPLKMLEGIYFLGSALTKDATLEQHALPDGMKIINYHSPRRDKVHQTAFSFMNMDAAGGQVGFDDTGIFQNYDVACAHAYKGVGVHIDYSQLATAIGYVTLYNRGVRIPGELKFNMRTRVADGDVWWNTILRTPYRRARASATVELQQSNARASYFRAVIVSPDGKRTRIARGENLHAILVALGVEQIPGTSTSLDRGDRP